MMATEFVPAEDRGEFLVIVELPPGTSFDQSVTTVSGVERSLLEIPEVTQVFSTVGVNGQTRASSLRVRTTKKDQRERGIGEIKEQVRAILADIPFVDGKVATLSSCRALPTNPRSTSSFAGTIW